MKVLITDTNAFFDIMDIEVLPEFFGLDFDICTTDFVIAETGVIDICGVLIGRTPCWC